MPEFLAALIFLFAALPIAATVLPRSGAFFLAPVISGVFAVLASMLHVVIDVPVLAIWVALVAASTIAVFAIPATRNALASAFDFKDRLQAELSIAATATVAALLALGTTPAPLGWDARSMWFAIPSWLNGPAEQYLTAQAGGAQTGWPDYPFFGPGSFATLWQLMGVREDLWAASRISGLLAIAVASTLFYCLYRTVGQQKNLAVLLVGLAGLLASAFILGNGSINNGYMDALQALTITATAAATLAWRRERIVSSTTLIAIVSVAAINVKQEGFWFTLAVLGLGLLYWAFKRQLWFAVALVPVLLAKVAWQLFCGFAGVPESGSTSSIAGNAPEMFSPGSQAWQIIGKVFADRLIPEHLALIFVLLIATALLFAFKLKGDQTNRLDALYLLAAPLAVIFIIVITYALGGSRDSIDWWLGTSYRRIMSTFNALAWFSLLYLVFAFGPELGTRAKKAPVAQATAPTAKKAPPSTKTKKRRR